MILPSSLEKIQLIGNGANSTIVGGFPSSIVGSLGSSLSELEITNVDIGSANFVRDISTLKRIVLKNCKVTSIDFHNENIVDYLDLSGGSITNVKNFEKLKLCKYINLENNKILPNSSFKGSSGSDETISSLLVFAYLNPNYPNLPSGLQKGNLKELYLSGNTDLKDFTIVSTLNWDGHSGF